MSTPESPKRFEIRVGGREVELRLGHCAVVLFRREADQELDYVAVDMTEDGEEQTTLRIFDNVQFARWLGGYAIGRDEDGELVRTTMYLCDESDPNDEPKTYRSLMDWNPPVIEKEKPTDQEKELWLDVQARNLEREWQEGFDGRAATDPE
jgi:hypothetical protein